MGSLGLFFTCYLVFARVAPVVAIAEIKSILKTSGNQYKGAHHHEDHDHSEVGHNHDHH
jgi:molybdopterin-containing oxidoreductase family membrane subunit